MMLLAGMCARRRTYLSLLRQRKVGQRKTTLLSVSLRFATGNLRCSCAGRAAELATRLRRCAQTTAASQITKAGVLRRQPAPRPALLGTARRAPAIRAIAALGPIRRSASPRRGRAQRSSWRRCAVRHVAGPRTGRRDGASAANPRPSRVSRGSVPPPDPTGPGGPKPS